MSVLQKHADAPEGVDALSKAVVDSVFQVHKHMGPGLLEKVYEECVCMELMERGIAFVRQFPIELSYKGKSLQSDFKLDVVVNRSILLELKAVERIHPVHEAQILSYLKLTGLPLGFLVNFNVPLIKDGIRRYAGQGLRDFVPSW